MSGDETQAQEVHETQPHRAVWEQQEGESHLHFSWFHTFLWLGEARSVVGAFNVFQAKKGKTKQVQASGAWNRISERWKWRGRAAVWDAQHRKEAEQRRARERIVKEKVLEERLFRIRERAIDKVEQMLNVPIVAVTTESADGKQVTVNPARWTFDTMVRLLQAQERLGAGDSGNSDETTVTIKGKNIESGAVAFRAGKGAEDFSDDELTAIVSIARAGGLKDAGPKDTIGLNKDADSNSTGHGASDTNGTSDAGGSG